MIGGRGGGSSQAGRAEAPSSIALIPGSFSFPVNWLRVLGTIASQPFTSVDKSRVREHGRDTLLPSSLHDEPVDVQRAVGLHQDPIYLALADLGEGRLRLGLRLHRLLDQHHPQAVRRLAI